LRGRHAASVLKKPVAHVRLPHPPGANVTEACYEVFNFKLARNIRERIRAVPASKSQSKRRRAPLRTRNWRAPG
jgi:hypothetical protein